MSRKGNLSLNRLILFRSLPIRSEHVRFFLKTPRCSYGLVKCSCDNRAENFSPQVEKVVSKFENDGKIIYFFRKILFSRCSSGKVECKFFAQSSKMIKKLVFSQNYFSSKCSSRKVECAFDNPAKKISPKVGK